MLGLKNKDVSLEARTLTVRRSYGMDTTKGGRHDVLPLPAPLLPYLRAALNASPSDFVFPRSDGAMHTDELDLVGVLRRALGRAGLVRRYRHVCRRCKARGEKVHAEAHKDDTLRVCTCCGMKLWPVALARQLRFHDLRGTTASLPTRAGVPLAYAQRILRRADPRLTANV